MRQSIRALVQFTESQLLVLIDNCGCGWSFFSLLFKLRDVITAILAMRILVQFVGQSIGLLLLHKRKGKDFFKWKMPLFPVPIIAAICIWLFIFYSTDTQMMVIAGIIISGGIIAFFIKSNYQKEWPFVGRKEMLKETEGLRTTNKK